MNYDVAVIGAGACGIMGAISSAKLGKKLVLLEQLPKIASKLKATGGGRCNLTNRLPKEQFLENFGKDGRFLQDCLNAFSQKDLEEFFAKIGVEVVAKDGFRVFPSSHNSASIINALNSELKRLNVDVITSFKVESVFKDELFIIKSNQGTIKAKKVIIATGGLGYPTLGATGDGYKIAKSFGHKIATPHPAMMPLKCKECWVANCRADTIAKATLQVDIKKYKKLKAVGDLIFTKDGIRGPVVLDFSREITPLLAKMQEVPLIANLVKGLNQEQIMQKLNANKNLSAQEALSLLLPKSVSLEFCKMCNIALDTPLYKQNGANRDKLYRLIAKTPLTVIGSDGFKMAMITRGGVSLKEVNPKTMQSKLIDGLYFCGEVLNIDGPCGGYNLQFAFSSGYLAGQLL